LNFPDLNFPDLIPKPQTPKISCAQAALDITVLSGTFELLLSNSVAQAHMDKKDKLRD